MANAVVMPAPPRGQAVGGNLMGMNPAKHVAGLALGAAITLATAPAVGQSAPQRVTSDTPEYCLHLLDRVSEMVRVSSVPPPEDVTLLSSEGRRMCGQGQTRGGILRLRRALMLMLQQAQLH